MKIVLTLLSFSMLMFTLGVARPEQHASESCGFTVQGEPAHPTVTGPDDILPLVYVVEQPDAPLEVVSVDLKGMWLSISHERTNQHFCAKYRVRNRSDRTVQGFEIMLELATIGGAGGGNGAVSSSSVLPGQAAHVEACGVNGGSGSAIDNYVRLLVYVDKVDFEDCHNKPSLRIPRSLKVHPVW